MKNLTSWWRLVPILASIELLGACTVSSNRTPPTATIDVSTSEAYSTDTSVPSFDALTPTLGYPTPTQQPANTQIQPTPNLPLAEGRYLPLASILIEDLNECRLPCWKGLVPGIATASEVDQALKDVFSVNGNYVYPTDSSGLYALGYWWSDPDGIPVFSIGSWLSKEDDRLIGLIFDWGWSEKPELDVWMSPREMLQELGPPQDILVYDEEFIDGSYDFEMLMLYEQGIAYEYGQLTTNAEMCFEKTVGVQVLEANRIILTQPITPYYSGFRWQFTQRPDLHDLMTPIEQSPFRVSPQTVAEMALQQGSLCLPFSQ